MGIAIRSELCRNTFSFVMIPEYGRVRGFLKYLGVNIKTVYPSTLACSHLFTRTH
jgi:hypothetical protein